MPTQQALEFELRRPTDPPVFRTYPPKERERGAPRQNSSDISVPPTPAKTLIAQLDAALDKPVKNIVFITEERDAGFRYDNIPIRNGHVCWTSLPQWLRDECARDKDIGLEVFHAGKDHWARFGLHTQLPAKRGPVRARIVWARALSVQVPARVADDVIEIFDSDDDDNDDGNAPPPPLKLSPAKRTVKNAFLSDDDSDGAKSVAPVKRCKAEKAKKESKPVASSSKVKEVVHVNTKPAKLTKRMTFGNHFKGKKKLD
ncbi:hypothetical protein AURDEDRAFT_177766 [Auricularia subglabra TFB-10046 SS5]|uniref:Uncharacterized protein n=1 Tax=Auricularia subglabra (strain TFB-10046 / SS5) TaxID=717982 RepID=J0WLF9_AURST|nr:hypothetical protein AURDEDRAFT_177766 [Auricularia subglabra TFB-10046 SS5]